MVDVRDAGPVVERGETVLLPEALECCPTWPADERIDR